MPYIGNTTSDFSIDTGNITNRAVTALKLSPSSVGSNGQVLSVDGSGNLQWSTDSALTLIDEDNMSSNSASSVPSQQSVKAYADTKAVLTGSTNNTITTVTGANAFQGEANLTYDGLDLVLNGTGDKALRWATGGTNKWSIYHNNGAGSLIAFDNTNNAERFKIDSGGRVSIGNSPTVHVDTIFHIEDSGETNIKIEGNTSTLGARISLQNNDATANSFSQYAFNDAGGQSTSAIQGINTDNNNNYGEIAFLTRNAQGTPPSERVRIDKDGKVGIGTTDPAALLDVKNTGGAAEIICSSSTQPRLMLKTTGTTAECRVDFGDSGDSSRGAIGYNHDEDALRFYTTGVANERMRITSTGTVAIGSNYGQTTNALWVSGNPGIKVQGGSGAGGNATLLELKHPNTSSSNNDGDGPAISLNGYYSNAEWAFAKICSVNSGSGYGADFQVHVHPANGTQGASLVKALSIVGDGTGANVTVTDGNLVIGTAGHGIDFSAQTASSATSAAATSEILDHYERGHWNPTFLKDGTTAASLDWVYGEYVRVGDIVHVSFSLGLTSESATYTTVKIGGFPFSVNFYDANHFFYIPLSGYNFQSGFGDSGDKIALFLQPSDSSGSSIGVFQGLSKAAATSAYFDTTTRLTASFSYCCS